MSMELKFNQNYWETRYQTEETGWDVGGVSEPLKAYFDQLKNKNIKILIPGCGRAYEGEYLHKNGFTNVYLSDITDEAFTDFRKRCPGFPKEHILVGDFFQLNQQFELIIEQTFFCALHPSERNHYAEKMYSLLSEHGKLVGLLFNTVFEKEGPPFGGNAAEYEQIFSKWFTILVMEPAYNSIKPRVGRELFIIMEKKD